MDNKIVTSLFKLQLHLPMMQLSLNGGAFISRVIFALERHFEAQLK